jgi:hypothetical protein
MDMAARASSKKAGLSIRLVRGFDITNDVFISRLDVLYGWKPSVLSSLAASWAN